jgi:hypothetical protein
MSAVVALLYENGSLNERARALQACSSSGGREQALGFAGNMSVLELVHAVLHASAPPPLPPSHPDLSGLVAAVSAAAAACGFGSLPSATGEKILAAVALGERAMTQGGVGSFATAAQLQRLQQQRSSAFAVIKAFYPLAPPDALDSRRLHIAFASKDFGFSSVGQLVGRHAHILLPCTAPPPSCFAAQINGALASLSLRCSVSLLSFGPGDDSPFFKQLPSRVSRFLDLSSLKQRDGFGVASQVRARSRAQLQMPAPTYLFSHVTLSALFL